MQLIRNIIKWINTDGLLHFLVCYSITLALTPLIGLYALIPTFIAAGGKEAYDYFIIKSNNVGQVVHDLICDAAGIIGGYLTLLIWFIFYF